MPAGMDRKHNHHNQKEGKMVNRRIGLLVLMMVVVFLAGVISLYAGETDKININTASAEELTRLKGIGPSHAAKIVAYREENGPFKTPEDVIKVPGIGQKTFDNNAELILVEKPDQN
jgi:competence protein ComEA